MKIGLISQEYPPETAKGGIGTQTFLKANWLTKMSHQVRVVSRSPVSEKSQVSVNGVEVIRIPSTSIPIFTELADWLSYSCAVAQEIDRQHKKDAFDILDFPEWACEGYVHLLNQSHWNRIPTVIQLHGPLVMLARTLGWPDIDTDVFYPRPVEKAPAPTIIFVGKMVRSKGVEYLAEAACEIAKDFPDLRLRLLGGGDDSVIKAIQEKVKARGLERMLEMTGYVDRQNLPVQLSQAHVFAAPSVYEGGPGFVYLEAMACGLPVVGCRGSGASECIQDGVTGMLVPPGDISALTAAISSILSDTEGRKAMGMNAHRQIQETADSKFCVSRIAGFYESVIEMTAVQTEQKPC